MHSLLISVIMLMTVCCFLLPPMAGEKVTVNGFAFVSAVMYLIYFSHTLPFHETEVPILGMKKSPFLHDGQNSKSTHYQFYSYVLQ